MTTLGMSLNAAPDNILNRLNEASNDFVYALREELKEWFEGLENATKALQDCELGDVIWIQLGMQLIYMQKMNTKQ